MQFAEREIAFSRKLILEGEGTYCNGILVVTAIISVCLPIFGSPGLFLYLLLVVSTGCKRIYIRVIRNNYGSHMHCSQ